MAVIKHISIKNASYNATVDYLTTQHDEFTNKPILDEHGRRIPREEFLLDGINCDPESFHQECQELNARYNQNQTRADIKAHHYILSFDPRDRDENGLTPEQAQQLAIAFAKKNFPGHQTIVCTHPDGHNSAGNIHTHIVINSVRALDVERQDFMERPADSLAGKKHHVTKDFLKYLKQETMNLCQQEGFYQVDLLSPAKIRVTDREYWAQRKGQHALDQSNAEQLTNGVTPTKTVFETDKGYLRRVISSIISDCRSYDEFQKKLYEQYGIEVHESRKQISFLLPDHRKPIRGKSLGTDFERISIERSIFKSSLVIDTVTAPTGDKFASVLHDGRRITIVVQLELDIKAMQNPFYAQKVKLSNLNKLVESHNFMVEHGLQEMTDIESLLPSTATDTSEKRASLKETQDRLKVVRDMIRYSGQYYANKKVYNEFRNARNKVKFREEHLPEIMLYESARKSLKELSGGNPIPSLKALREERDQLVATNNAQYETYSFARSKLYELQAIHQNLSTYIKEKTLEKNQEQSQERS